MVDLDNYTFRTEAPDWVGSLNNAEYHVGVLQENTSRTFYKALIQLDEGRNREVRWRVWEAGSGRKDYGPDLPPEVMNMLVAYMDEQR